MAHVEPTKSRAIVRDVPEGLEMIIPSKKNPFLMILLAFWLALWTIAGVSTIRGFVWGALDPGVLSFIAVWLLFWATAEIFAVYMLLWNLVGCEVTRLTSFTLALRKEMFGFGVTREYDLGYMSNLRVAHVSFNPWDIASSLRFWGIGGGVIAFDYGASTFRFAAGVEEVEARRLVQAIKSRHSIPDE